MRINNFLMLNVGYATHMGDWNFENINSPFTRIYLVTEGTATVRLNEEEYSLSPGHMYIIPAFNTHSDINDGVFNHYYVHIYEEVKTGEDIISAYDFPFEIEEREIDRMLFDCLVKSNEAMILKSSDPRMYDNEHSLIECVKFNRQRPLDVRMESLGIISQLIGRFLKYARPKYRVNDERIKQALKIANSKINEPIRVEDLAKDACMSPGHFIRLFKEELGCTPTQFLIDRKIMKAKLMLASESIMMKEIAYRLGYEDVSYFTRLFKKHVGITPSLYRQTYNSTSY